MTRHSVAQDSQLVGEQAVIRRQRATGLGKGPSHDCLGLVDDEARGEREHRKEAQGRGRLEVTPGSEVDALVHPCVSAPVQRDEGL